MIGGHSPCARLARSSPISPLAWRSSRDFPRSSGGPSSPARRAPSCGIVSRDVPTTSLRSCVARSSTARMAPIAPSCVTPVARRVTSSDWSTRTEWKARSRRSPGTASIFTLDEFRGRSLIRRGSLTLAMTPTDATSGSARRALVHRTSSTGGGPTPLPLALPFEADHAVNACLFLAARGNQGWRHALSEVPGGAALRHVLWLSGLGQPPAAWFSQVDPGRDLPARYAWSWRAVKAAALLGGTRIPRPRVVPIDDPAEILGWMRRCLDTGVVPHLWTFVTSAVRVCQAAETRGVRLDGVQFTANSEPITAPRVAAIERTGARMGGYYGSMETGPLGYGCLAPVSADEMHVLGDLHAVWHADGSPALPGLPTGAVLVSSLRATAPVLLLNVALGDRAARLERRCGCPVEACGWTSRLHSIRSYARVSVGGMTFFDADLIRVLEEALPARFGGGPTDYQLAGGGAGRRTRRAAPDRVTIGRAAGPCHGHQRLPRCSRPDERRRPGDELGLARRGSGPGRAPRARGGCHGEDRPLPVGIAAGPRRPGRSLHARSGRRRPRSDDAGDPPR